MTTLSLGALNIKCLYHYSFTLCDKDIMVLNSG